MWFLIKGSFWTTATLVALSFLSSQPEKATGNQPQIEVSDAIGAATEAYGYISGLCAEKPDVCEKGAEAFDVIQHRAREGARVAYQMIDRHLSDKEKASQTAAAASRDDKITTGSVIPLPRAKPAI